MRVVLCLIVLVALAVRVSADHWAVLVAGSSTYGNYRHQADVCHANNILLDHGVPADHIITMMYDDIAQNAQNPFKGKLFNHPSPKGDPGKDVYARCQQDYTKEEVTPENFLHVLKGEASQVPEGRKVLQSTAEDDVFINFSDHGGTGIICFPEDDLHAADLIAALKYMHDHKMYKRLVFYLEACESGSMFWKLLSANISIYATTAANHKESSYGWYCDASVNGKPMYTCLGDHYSINWMEDSDTHGVLSETLGAQFLKIKGLTNDSHVMQYGDVSGFTNLPVVEFVGNKTTAEEEAAEADSEEEVEQSSASRGVRAYDVKLFQLQRQFDALSARAASLSAEERAQLARVTRDLHDERRHRAHIDHVIAQLVQRVGQGKYGRELRVHNGQAYEEGDPRLSCYRQVLQRFRVQCGRDDYSGQYTHVLSNMCELAVRTHMSVRHVLHEIDRACHA